MFVSFHGLFIDNQPSTNTSIGGQAQGRRGRPGMDPGLVNGANLALFRTSFLRPIVLPSAWASGDPFPDGFVTCKHLGAEQWMQLEDNVESK